MFKTEIGKDLIKAKALLEASELVAIPTETVYGLAGNGLNAVSIAKIYEAKNRPQFNPLILHVSSISQMEKLVKEVPDPIHKLLLAFSPGPITYLLPKSDLIPDLVTAGSHRVAIRIPDHPLTLELLNMLDFPLAAPSANPSGYVSPVEASHVLDGLNGKIPYILDGGPCKVGLESTIVGYENNSIVVHRLGAIDEQQLKEVSGCSVEFKLSHQSPTAPGQMKSHYTTHKPIIVGDLDDLIDRYSSKKIAILSFQRSFNRVFVQRVISPSGNLIEAASNLFKAMRELDASTAEIILAEVFPNEGIGRAINDRLQRAAHVN